MAEFALISPQTERYLDFQSYCRDAARVIHDAANERSEAQMKLAIEATAEALLQNRSLLVCGNGGSASDAMHITGELVGRFLRERRALKAICLSSNTATLTAWANDYSYETVFSRQVEAYGEAGGVFLGLSTSGNSKNVLLALDQARTMGMTTIGMTGAGGGKMATLCDILLEAPSRSTPEIQQVHICMYHYFCLRVEERVANNVAENRLLVTG